MSMTCTKRSSIVSMNWHVIISFLKLLPDFILWEYEMCYYYCIRLFTSSSCLKTFRLVVAVAAAMPMAAQLAAWQGQWLSTKLPYHAVTITMSELLVRHSPKIPMPKGCIMNSKYPQDGKNATAHGMNVIWKWNPTKSLSNTTTAAPPSFHWEHYTNIFWLQTTVQRMSRATPPQPYSQQYYH